MKKLIKLVPMMALLLGLGVYTVNAKMKAVEAEKAQTEKEWMLNGSQPSNPTDYVPAPDGTRNDCKKQEETVCVVIAPETSSGQPNFAAIPGLLEALAGDLEHENIIKGPYVPTP